MPKEILTLNDFSGGLNSVKDSRDIEFNELAKANNVMVDEQGVIRTVGGMITHSSINTHGTTLVGGFGLEILESDYETESVSVTGTVSISGANDSIFFFALIATITGATALITTTTNHGFTVGQTVLLDATTGYDGIYTIITTPALDTFTITHADSGDKVLGAATASQYTALIFTPGTEILISGSTSNDGFYTVLAGSTTFCLLDRDVTTAALDTGVTITSLPKEDIITVLSDADNGKVDVFSKNNATWTADKITLDPTGVGLEYPSKTVYYSIDGAIRTSDAEFKNGSRVRWYGHIKRTHFAGASIEDNYFNFFEKDNKLSPPTDCDIGDTYPTANVGFDLEIVMSADTNSTWEAATYEVAISFIYDGNQESLLFDDSGANTFVVADGEKVVISAHATITAVGNGYNPRISGGRAYARISASDDEWVLLCDIDMRRGCRATLNGTYQAWATVSGTEAATGDVTSLSQNLDTFETLNGYDHDVASNSIGENGEQWKFGLAANRRAFIFNVRRYDDATGQNVTFGDRVYYSLTNKFDTFLPDNYITPVRGDAENYVGGIEFADRILAFKQNSVQIINIASPSDISWFMESKHKYMGIRNPSAITRTEFGIAWINDSGCYFYDGEGLPKNLIGDKLNKIPSKIDDDEWAAFIGITTGHQSIIGYERHKKQLIIMKDCTGNVADGGDAYLYDFNTNSWVKLINAFTDSVVYSNFVHDWNGDLVIGCESGANVLFYKWDSDDTTEKSDIEIRTKDIDFNDPASYTLVYKIIVTYKTTVAQANDANGVFAYSVDGKNSWTVFDQIAIDGAAPDTTLDVATIWQTAVINHSSNTPLKVQSIQLKIDLPTATYFNINDISIVYRNLRRARVV